MTSPPAAPFVALETGVNRAAKADRAAVVPARGQTQTIALRVDGVADTSVCSACPWPRNPRPSGGSRLREAWQDGGGCEPVVSVLTEVSKLLQPGRCVT